MSFVLGFREKAKKSYVDLYNLSADVLGEVQNNNNFYFTLSGHNHASLLEGLRDRMGVVFTDQMKPHVTLKKMKPKEKDAFFKSVSGIFGGPKYIWKRVKRGRLKVP